MTVAEYVVAFLRVNGIRIVFGYPGSSLLPLYRALQRSRGIRTRSLASESGARGGPRDRKTELFFFGERAFAILSS